ncbi:MULTISPECIES: DUF6049 family protein [unclassified Nocardioides]|uniref:DUF6049 family protein n=1 Tax=unclassified Nocardioides TaxID=2615069 RepID=UPI0009EF845A|nr:MULTISPECIES: DUF6049 family protein [unclassified Nocardioides]GAW48075.1 uncharacterized protein (Precursor) [Nocardioides sp. PD653-B2]GAW53622.1 uncharacterized protein (Precursor) [Nocardioides sp. PD653]
MLRPVSLLPALAAVATLAAVVVAPMAPASAGTAPKARADQAPLAVTIDSLSPSTIPQKGPIRVSGSVTNNDTEAWTSIQVFAFVSDTPMTTADELADAAQTDADADVGERITDTFDTVDELAPGETHPYTLRVPRSEIGVDEAGVYWFGVHALGTSDDGRISGADGRARTFLPLVARTRKSVDTALVLPVRREILHTADGSLAKVPTWTRTLSPGGRMRSMVDFGAAAGSRPITWLVDPAVPDAVARLVAGNPPRSLEPTVSDDDTDGDTGDASESPSPSVQPSADGDDEADAPKDPEVAAAAEAGTSWLQRLHEALEGSQILTLPYGDVDVAAAAAYDPEVYQQARRRSNGDLAPWGLPTSPVVSSPSGFIDQAGIEATETGTPVLVTDRMFGPHAPAVARADGHTLAVSSSGAASGGPGPDNPMAPVALRQRIVSEAAVRLMTPGRKPLIVTFPTTWSPDSTTGFFEGLDLDWLHLTTLTDAMQREGSAVSLEDLDYPARQVGLELDAANFAAADNLVRAGDTLQNLLTQNDEVGTEVRDEAFSDTSYSNRLRPGAARASADSSRTWIDNRLRSVRIDAPKAVILSGGSGRFAATITNGLDQPVTVKITALTEPPLKVAVPAESVDIGAGRGTTVLLNASSSALGIRNVTLALTDVKDAPLGSSDDLPIRSNRVSNVIWLILGTGVALLFGAIVVRLFRRLRAAAGSA